MNKDTMLNEWEIARTVDEISMDLDQKKLDSALEAFSEDAVITVMEDGKVMKTASGKAAVRDMIAAKMANLEVMFHNNGTRVIDVKTLDQAAVSHTHCVVRQIQKDPQAIINQYQWMDDKLIKVNGLWYIVERTIGIVSRSVI